MCEYLGFPSVFTSALISGLSWLIKWCLLPVSPLSHALPLTHAFFCLFVFCLAFPFVCTWYYTTLGRRSAFLFFFFFIFFLRQNQTTKQTNCAYGNPTYPIFCANTNIFWWRKWQQQKSYTGKKSISSTNRLAVRDLNPMRQSLLKEEIHCVAVFIFGYFLL